MSLVGSAFDAVKKGKGGFGLSRKAGSAFKSVGNAFSSSSFTDFVRDPTSALPGTSRGYFRDASRSVEKRVSGAFTPDFPDIPVPPTMGAPIQHASRAATTVSDSLFGRGVGHRSVRTRGPTALTHRRPRIRS